MPLTIAKRIAECQLCHQQVVVDEMEIEDKDYMLPHVTQRLSYYNSSYGEHECAPGQCGVLRFVGLRIKSPNEGRQIGHGKGGNV